ncbi:response regulator [Desulfococcaceae bacterium HSG7]|nr:response regulator [Desulfococcaceae bacterium HSG7]
MQKKVKVLIAEDDFIVSEAIQKEIEDLGYTVAGKAPDGQQAVEMTLALQPDVVLMDIEMPDMDGLEATRQISQTCPTPVVILTAYETPDLVKQAGEAGAGAYLVKMPKAKEIERAVAIATARFDDMTALRRLNTELQNSNEALRKSEGKLNAMLGSIGAHIVMMDKNLNILWTNDVSKKVFGSEIVGRKCYEIYHGKNSPYKPSSCLALKAFEDGQIHKHEIQVQMPDGKTADFVSIASVALRDKAGRPSAVIEIFHDITERKAIEKERRLHEKRKHLIEKAASLSRMGGAVAHNFNNMLYVVTGNLEMALNDLVPNTDITKSITSAHKAALRAAEMSGLMLTYLGQAAGKSESFDLAMICRSHLPQLQIGLPGDISLETALPSPGPVVEADSAQIRQVMTALITNAAEAMDDGFTGKVQVSVNAVKATEIQDDGRAPVEWTPSAKDYVCLSVTDTGRGMDAETVGKIFDPFYTDKFTGRGLGLAVALGLVKSSDGCITVTSEPRRGSVFRVFLPLSSKVVIQPEDSAKTPAIKGGGLVLIVDDTDSVREVAEAMLEIAGFEAVSAKGGAEAVEIFREKHADFCLVLSDLSMPFMDGWETMAALRRIRPDIPVILSSGYNEDQAMSGKHAEQPQVFLQKPYRMEALKDALAKALAG